MLGVMLGLAPSVRDAVGVAVNDVELVGVLDRLEEGEALAVTVTVADGVVVGDPDFDAVVDAVTLEVGLGVKGALGLELELDPRESDEVGDTVPDALRLTDGDAVGVALAVGVTVELAVLVCVDVRAAEGDSAPLSVPLADGLGVSLLERDALSPEDIDVVGVGVLLGVMDGVEEISREAVEDGEGVSELVLVPDGVSVAVGVPLPLELAVALDESETLGVMEALAPTVTEPVGDADADAAIDSLAEGVPIGVPVDEGVGLTVPDGVALVVDEKESELVIEPVPDGLAPTESEAVGERDTDRESERVELGVGTAVTVPEPVSEDVAVGVALTLAVAELVTESDPVFDGLAPIVNEAVGERETDPESDAVELGVIEDVGVLEVVMLLVGVTL